MGSSYKVATVWGIPIRVHLSLLIVVIYLGREFGLLLGILMELGLATSIVLHELGHSLVAIRKGCRVREITLMLIGGAAQMERIPTRALDEFLMAFAGPAVSCALGFACVWGGSHLALPDLRPLGQPDALPFNYVEFLGWANLVLMTFNLLPAFPMDGGRMLRAMLSPRLGRLRATAFSARLGQVIAVIMGISAFGPGGLYRFLVFVAIAFFIYIAAGNEYQLVQMQERAKRPGDDAPFPPGQWPGRDDEQVSIGPPPYARRGRSRRDIEPVDMD